MNKLIGIIFLFFCATSNAQNYYKTGLTSRFNTKISCPKDWKLTLRFANRQIFKEGWLGTNLYEGYQYERTDFSILAYKKIKENHFLGGGYLLRYKDQNFLHRFSQRYTKTRTYNSFRFKHRIAFEQTVKQEEAVKYRLRYRFTFTHPLGKKEENPPFYVRINHEYLWDFQEKSNDLHIWFIPLLGYHVNNQNRVELGLEYRINEFLHNDYSENQFWIYLAWHFSIHTKKED